MKIMARKGSKGQMVQIDLQPGDPVHFIGICGTAMAGMAGVLKTEGFDVQGSDQDAYPPMSTQLEKTGISLAPQFNAAHIHPKLKLAVVGNSILSTNVEAEALMKHNIPYTSLPELIRSTLIGEKHSLVISGTHGKTTTTSMMAWLAHQVGHHPNFLIGGISNNFKTSFKNKESSWFVIEGDEYDTAFFDKRPKFIHYHPYCVILTSIEFDHVDIYDDINKVKNSFELLIQSLPQDGVLVAHGEDPNIQDILQKASCKKVITYGITQGDYLLKDRVPLNKEGHQEFNVQIPKGRVIKAHLPLFGLHNAMNALGALALCDQLGWDLQKVLLGLKTFKGVRRRFQILKETKQAILIEDFAHHPTAARSTITALRERYPDHQVFVVFEPRSASSRRNVFQKQYTQSFSKADKVFVASPFKEFEIEKSKRFSSQNLVQDLKVMGTHAEFHLDVKKMACSVVEKAQGQKSVIVVMSNGPFEGVHQLIKARL